MIIKGLSESEISIKYLKVWNENKNTILFT